MMFEWLFGKKEEERPRRYVPARVFLYQRIEPPERPDHFSSADEGRAAWEAFQKWKVERGEYFFNHLRANPGKPMPEFDEFEKLIEQERQFHQKEAARLKGGV